jgi:membrane protease YdiL (CAAX protease family)
MVKKSLNILGPLFISALCLFLSFQVMQGLATFLGTEIDLLSPKNLGKIIFTVMAFVQLFLFYIIRDHHELAHARQQIFGWWSNTHWIKPFVSYFLLFFALHLLTLFSFVFMGYATYTSCWDMLTGPKLLNIGWGFLATFMLAWTEEGIFRGCLFPYFRKSLGAIGGLLATSLCFMTAHGLGNPIYFFTVEWKIALGLFLFGAMLNAIYLYTGKLYTNMGAHAGAVFVKVLQRRLPFLTFIAPQGWAWWLDSDLRQSLLVHALFGGFALFFIVLAKRRHKKSF